MNEKQGRREFLAQQFQWAAAAGVLGGIRPSLFAQSQKAQSESKIITRTLGKTGITLPIVSMGVMNADVPGLIRRSYEVGIRHFDTAAVYQHGRNEEMVGSVIKEMGVRDKVVITTKVALKMSGVSSLRDPQAYTVFRQVFEGSLKRLQTDYVDVLHYHAVDNVEDANAEGPLRALAELKKEGKIRFTGISTHRAPVVLPEAIRSGVFDVACVTVNYTMASNKDLLGVVDQAAKAGIGIVAMKTQAGGLKRPDPRLGKNLPPHSQTALLKWVLRNPSITTAIPGFTTYDQLEQNFSVASNLEYTDAEKWFLAGRSFVAQAQFCQQCGQCLGDCPLGVDIPTLMRSHMYAVQYSNHELARSTLAQIERGRGLEACAWCTTCKAACRNHVNIADKIAQLKTLPIVAA